MDSPRNRVRVRPGKDFTKTIIRSDGFVGGPQAFKQDEEYFFDVVGSKGFNPCNHVLVTNYGSELAYFSRDTYLLYEDFGNASSMASFTPKILDHFLDDFVFELGFQKNDDFELLNFLWELDDTLDIFSKKFWQSLSYGSVQWGLLPFISDVKGIYNSLTDLFTSKIGKEISQNKNRFISRRFRDVSLRSEASPGERDYWSFDGTVHLHGFINLVNEVSDSMTVLSIFLDELGVHPDLKTVWDLIPMSFIVDYYIPIGDSLEKIHPRGWFAPEITWDGAGSITGYYATSSPFYYTPTPVAQALVHVRRTDLHYRKSSRRPVQLQWKTPSLLQLANTAYVSRSKIPRASRKLRKRKAKK